MSLARSGGALWISPFFHRHETLVVEDCNGATYDTIPNDMYGTIPYHTSHSSGNTLS